ncbi:8-amino-7-oxononanoate synthase [Agaribacterium sp. ZY112]|uniref:8-amino-7-oxononanoate synthase n=1 Tax=Agaribacterium sp. ZY112 TaxID=3233574 RepID=UPI0035268592
MPMDEVLASALMQRQEQGRLRRRRNVESEQAVELQVNGQPLINFSSNDYLGLAENEELRLALAEAAGRWGLGSGASHLVCGHSQEHHLLEQELADFVGREKALLFSTGYMANMGCVQALVGRDDAVFEDKLNHASLLDGALLSRAKRQRYAHLNYEQLNHRLSKSEAKRKLVLTDSVFSMDGDIAELNLLSRCAKEHDAWLMVDDAHGFAVLGQQGQGCTEHFKLDTQQVPIYMATLGKALGGFGAFVAGSEALIDYLCQFARPYIYTTALPPALAAANRVALRLVKEQGWRREKLNNNIAYFKQQSAVAGLVLMPSDTAIQPLLIGEDKQLMALAAQIEKRGFLVGAIRPPTVPEGTARLRITLSAAHSLQHIDALVAAIVEGRSEVQASYVKEFGLG